MYLSFGLILFFCSFSSSPPPFAPPVRVSSQSHPSIFNLLTCFLTLGALRASPSASTRHIPPLTRFVPILSRSLCPSTSASSVGSPSIQTGQFLTIRRISSSEGMYCRLATLL